MAIRMIKRNALVKLFNTNQSILNRSNALLLSYSSYKNRSCFSTFTDHKEDSSIKLSDKGAEAFAKKNYQEALKYYLQSKEIHISPVVLLKIAKCYEYLKDVKSAFHEYQIIIRFFENSLDEKTREMVPWQECYVSALIGAGVNNYSNDYDKEFEYWTKASKFKNIRKHILGNHLIAGMYNRQGNHREAIQYYNESIQELQDRPECSQILNESCNYYYRGLSYTSLGQVEPAIQDFSRIINEYRAGTNADSILNDNSDRSMTFLNRGLCFCSLNDFELGFKDLEEALKECDNDLGIVYSVAQAYRVRFIETQSVKFKEKAIQLFRQILARDRTHSQSQQYLTELEHN